MSTARAVAEPCEQLSELAQRLTNEALQRRDRRRANVNAARIAFIIVGPAVGIFLGWWVARGLHHSISEISVTLRDAIGDLEQEIGSVEVRPSDDAVGLPALQQQVQYVSGRIKQVVDELHRARGEALRSERLAAVGELAAGIAHEVRNPLTSVKLLIQAVERNQPPGSGDNERLKIVRQEIARIETTMSELLDYAKPPKLNRIRHDVRETLRRALNLVDGRARQGEIAVDERLPAGPIPVDADPEQLNQVFVNLLLNAIEAMDAGGRLHVDIETPDHAPRDDSESASDDVVRVVFRDTGSGISDEVMDRLFEPFVTSKERGIGLGLAISRQIMQEHGGRLSACNPQSGGAMFVAELPLADAQHRDAATAHASNDVADIVHAPENSRAETMETVNH
jgi:signal transduction histidine kinase